MKRMLFNATHPEEMRVALVDGQRLLDLDIESTASNLKKGNIYKAKVTRIEPSLEAAFVDYGSERQGFLPLKEVARHYFNEESKDKPIHKVGIADALKDGQEILVQIEKEERGNKGAALTTFISLAGRFLVLMPNNPKGGGISRRIAGEEREQMREIINNLDLPESHSVILRTAGMGRSEEEIAWDADFLMKLWHAIEQSAENEEAPKLIYQDSSLVVRALRDYLRDDVKEVIIDDAAVYDRALKFVNLVMPERNTRIKFYDETIPLLARYQVEQQIEAAFSREIRLPSGGAIVIDHTEAVVTIDVNSAKSTKGADIEDTALHTNTEAAEEIARQLKIRDIGGLIVIDFIDMQNSKNQRKIEQTLSSLVKTDRARIQIGKISRFGLLEMSRQRIRGALVESNYHTCPRCNGNGIIRGVVSSALSILRVIEEESLKENTEAILVHLPIETATYLLNEKRYDLALMERRLSTRITIIPNSNLETPYFKIERLRGDEYGQIAHIPSHRIELDDDTITQPNSIRPVVLEPAAVQMDEVTESIAPAPISTPRPARNTNRNKANSRGNNKGNASRANAKPTNTKQTADKEEKGVFSFVTRLFGGAKKSDGDKTTDERQGQQSARSNSDSKNERGSRSNQSRNNNRRTNANRGGNNQSQRRSNQNNSQRPQRTNQQNRRPKNAEKDGNAETAKVNTQNANQSADQSENQSTNRRSDNDNNRSNRNRRAHYARQRGRGRGNRNQQQNSDNEVKVDSTNEASNSTDNKAAQTSKDKPTPKPQKSRANSADKGSTFETTTDPKPKETAKEAPAKSTKTTKPTKTTKATKSTKDSAGEKPKSETQRKSTRKPKEDVATSDSKTSAKAKADKKSDKPAKTEKAEATEKPKRTRKAPVKKASETDGATPDKPKTAPRRTAAKKSEDGETKAPTKRRTTAKKVSDDSDGAEVKKAPAKRRAAPKKIDESGDTPPTNSDS